MNNYHTLVEQLPFMLHHLAMRYGIDYSMAQNIESHNFPDNILGQVEWSGKGVDIDDASNLTST